MLHCQHFKNLPKPATDLLCLFIDQRMVIVIVALDSNVSVTFINTIHPTSFDYGILLKVSEQMLLSNSNAYNDRDNDKYNDRDNDKYSTFNHTNVP